MLMWLPLLKLHYNNKMTRKQKASIITTNIIECCQKNEWNTFHKFACRIHDTRSVNNEVDGNIINGIKEKGIFLSIFDYLGCVEIINGVYQTCKLFHQAATSILNQKYLSYVCGENWMKKELQMVNSMVESNPNKRELRVDAVVMLNGLTIYILNQYHIYKSYLPS